MLKSSGGLGSLTLLLFCVAGVEGQAPGQVKGTATYRERMALPRDAVFEATLEDVSKAYAPAEVIGQSRVERPGNPPIRFEITYDPSAMWPKMEGEGQQPTLVIERFIGVWPGESCGARLPRSGWKTPTGS
jgi:type III secretion system (T3SS) chaperone YscW